MSPKGEARAGIESLSLWSDFLALPRLMVENIMAVYNVLQCVDSL